MKPLILPSEFAPRLRLASKWGLLLAVPSLAATLAAPARSQTPPAPAPSIVDAARNAREQKSNSTVHPKVITNDDLAPQPAPPTASPAESAAQSPSTPATAQEPSAQKTAGVVPAEKTGCDNPDAQGIQMELQAAEAERDQLRSDLSYQPKIISDNDVDMSNFKPGGSGIDMGSPALSQSQPQAPARVDEVILDQKIASLKEALRIACGSPEDAPAQRDLYSAQQRLALLEQELSLDRAAYYSKPDYSDDTAGKAKLDAEQQEIESVQAEIERLKSELAASKTNQTSQ